MLTGIVTDLQSIAIFFLPFMALQVFPQHWRQKQWHKLASAGIFYLTSAAVIVLALVETAYFPFSFQRFNAASFRLAGDTPILYFLGRFWHLSILMVVLIVATCWLYRNKFPSRSMSRRSWLVYLLCLSAFWMLAFSSGRKRPVMPSDLGLFLPANATILATNTPQHLLFTWYLNKYRQRNLLEHKNYMTDEEADSLYRIFHYPDDGRQFKPYNVVIFVLESFSRGYLEPGHPSKAYTPFLDSIRRHSLVCTNAFANASISLGGLTAIMGSIPPVTAASHMESPYTHNFLEPFFYLLQQKGYNNAFFYGGNEDHFGFRRLAGQLGFNQYFSGNAIKDKKLHDGIWGVYDGPFFRFAGEQLSATKPPFAAVIFNLSSHYPYRIPAELDGVLPKGSLNSHQSITYVDLSLKEFFIAAQEQSWYQNTVFVFVADHWSKEDNAQKGTGPYRFTIPLMFYLPDGSLQGEYSGVADQLSIIPTLADIMGFPQPFMAFGNSLLDTGRAAFSYGLLEFPYLYHIIGDSYTLQYNEKAEQVAGLYAYKEAGGMSKDLADSLPEVREKLERQLKAFIQVHHRSMLDNRLVPPNP